jgi:hypothetical protein
MSFDTIAETLGVDFDVSAASTSDETYTCVLRRVEATLPDVSLAVTPTRAETDVYRMSVVPKGATVVTDLGKYGYSRQLPPGAGAGPGLEVGWLSGNQRLMLLRFHTPAGAPASDAAALTPKLVALARKIDQASV